MNNNLRSIRNKVFTHETNITKMEEGRFTDCDHMRFHTEGLIKKPPILRALEQQDTVSLHMSREESDG